MPKQNLQELFVRELSDTYNAEKQLTKALPRLARAASDPELAEAFKTHLEETQGQVERIDRIVESSGFRLKRVKCAAMEGLVEESREIIEELERGPVLDAALIAAAQKVEHYEIASYGTLLAWAEQLGQDEPLKLLQETLEEEKNTDRKLTEFAKKKENAEAEREAA